MTSRRYPWWSDSVLIIHPDDRELSDALDDDRRDSDPINISLDFRGRILKRWQKTLVLSLVISFFVRLTVGSWARRYELCCLIIGR